MTLRAGIIGAGLMGKWHAHALQRAGGTLVGVCDLDPGKARELAGDARVHSDLDELLRETRIDVLHVCTPLHSHFELASAALERGIHVLVEKPMTPAASETERLFELAAQRQVLVCPVHQFLFQDGVEQARARVREIGELRHFEATFCSAGGQRSRADELDEVVAEILPHPLSLMQVFAPGSLREEGWFVSRAAPGEYRAVVNSRGICFSILISMNSRPTTAALRLLGTAGTIQIDFFHGFSVIEPGLVSRARKILHPFDLSARIFASAGANLAKRAATAESAYPGLRTLIERFYAAISTCSASPIRREEAVEVALSCERLKGSASASAS
ncbi:MAG: Gfo/Idh/MocA family protein [Chthoniobacterales bacterium]